MENIKGNEYLSIIEIAKIIKKRAVFIIFITILSTCIMSIRSFWFSVPTYQATTTAVIVKGDSSIIKNPEYTQDEILLYEKVVETYLQIAQSNQVMDKTAEELKSYSVSQLRGMVTASQRGETQIIQINVMSTNSDDAANIANIYCKNFIEESMRILPVGKIEVLDAAKVPANPIPVDKVTGSAIGFLAGLLIAIALVLLKHHIDSNRIKTEKQVANVLGIPVLTIIE